MTNDAQSKITEAPLPSKPTRFVSSIVVVMCAVWVALLFVLVRQSGEVLGQTYLVLYALHLVALIVIVQIWNPALIVRRMRSPIEKGWDAIFTITVTAMLIAMVVVARHDLLTRDADLSPLGLYWLIGLCIFVFGWAILIWSMAMNPFFESYVRIQTNHGHHVIDSGPYAYVRHPGYIGFSALLLSTPILLASVWTALPSIIAVSALVTRTALEDRMLQSDLPGYREYAGRIRYRLIPGVW